MLSGQITQISPPASDIQNSGDPQSNTAAFVWSERTNFVLPTNVSVNMTGPGTSNSGNGYNPSPGLVASGTPVDTYIFHSDPVGGAAHTYDFTVTSSTPILGVIDTISGLAGTDSLLGSPTTTYPGASTDRALEGADTLMWGAGNTLTVHLDTSSFVDEFRIMVAQATAVPEPGTLALAGVGALGLLGCRIRRRRA
jgi:hypothetical protein